MKQKVQGVDNVLSYIPTKDIKYQRYEVKQYNIIMDVLGGWCRVKLKALVGSKSEGVLRNMWKAVLLGTLNIARTFKVAT